MDKVKVMVYLPEPLARALRIEAALTRESQSAIVEQAVRRELERRVQQRGGHGPTSTASAPSQRRPRGRA